MNTPYTLTDALQHYPRICAHRGFNTVNPENSIPAYASAIALGTEEIELDLWPTRDGQIVVCHDSTVDRVTDGTGKIVDLTYEQIRQMDAGVKFSQDFSGLQIPLFEDVLKQFARRTIINIHIKSVSDGTVDYPEEMVERMHRLNHSYWDGATVHLSGAEAPSVIPREAQRESCEEAGYDPVVFQKILDLIDRYDCRDYVYFTGAKDVMSTARELAPHIPRCCLEGHLNYTIVENALKYDCRRVQLCKLFLTKEMIDEAHAHGLICNLFWSDDAEEAKHFLSMGIDTILTNNALLMRNVFDSLKEPSYV